MDERITILRNQEDYFVKPQYFTGLKELAERLNVPIYTKDSPAKPTHILLAAGEDEFVSQIELIQAHIDYMNKTTGGTDYDRISNY